MTATATRTRTPADVASWGTWKDHGHAAVLGYMGRDRKSAGMVVRTVKVTVGKGNILVLRSTKDNEIVAQMGPAGRFWAVTAPAEPVEVPQPRNGQTVLDEDTDAGNAARDEALQAEFAQPTGDAKAITRAARPSRNAKLSPCTCGCGAQVRGLYKQGHDARHAGNVARAAIAALIADPDTNLADTSDLVAELPTEALRAKATKMIAARIK